MWPCVPLLYMEGGGGYLGVWLTTLEGGRPLVPYYDMDNVVKLHGMPLSIVLDQDIVFTSEGVVSCRRGGQLALTTG